MKKTIWTPAQNWFCTLLRQVREEAGLTQVEVAGKLGKPQSFISKYEKGERRLDLVELRGVCMALGISLVELVERFEKDLPE